MKFHFGWRHAAEFEVMDCGLSCRTLCDGLRAGLLPISPLGGAAALGADSVPAEALLETDLFLDWPDTKGEGFVVCG
jgi:hypothetical protein